MNVYIEGQNIRLDLALKDLDGDPVNAGSGFPRLVLDEYYNTGSGTAYVHGVDDEITNSGSGAYGFDSVEILSGQYRYEWQVDGDAPWRERGEFRVVPDLES